jgi:hypothetical protein
MKTRLLAFALLMASLSAHAYTEGSTEEINARIELCETYGQTGQLYYQMALQDRRTEVTHNIDPSSVVAVMRQHIEDDIFTNYKIYDMKAAFMHAATYCFDNVNRLDREIGH